jgi:transcriptional regulator with XRE-family HTH domain
LTGSLALVRIFGMSKRRLPLSQRLRRIVDDAGVSRYRICMAAKVDPGAMSRFMTGKTGLTLVSLDALADVLGLELVARGPMRLPPPAKLGRPPKKGKR